MSISKRYDKPEESPGFLLWQVTHEWQKRINNELRKHDLTHMQFVLLANTAWLTNEGNYITQVQLAEQTKVHVMMVSQVLKKLEKKGLITRVSSPKDPRANNIKITKAGFSKAIEAIETVEKVDGDFFRLFNKDVNTFNRLLGELLKHST